MLDLSHLILTVIWGSLLLAFICYILGTQRSTKIRRTRYCTDSPPCSKWQVWIGKEIEGFTYIDHKTLFVRSLKLITLDELRENYPKINRIWFCKEMLAEDQHSILRALDMWRCVCVECTPETIMQGEIWKRAHIYLKLPYSLKPMLDHICMGEAFHDEAFQIGTGRTVSPAQYLNDERIM